MSLPSLFAPFSIPLVTFSNIGKNYKHLHLLHRTRAILWCYTSWSCPSIKDWDLELVCLHDLKESHCRCVFSRCVYSVDFPILISLLSVGFHQCSIRGSTFRLYLGDERQKGDVFHKAKLSKDTCPFKALVMDEIWWISTQGCSKNCQKHLPCSNSYTK